MKWALLIHEIRRARGLKQEAAAEIFGVSQATLSRWEKGAVEPTIGMRHRILKIMQEIDPLDEPEKSTSVKTVCEFIFEASNGNTKSIQAMLSQGVDVNCEDYDQRTALHLAAAEGHRDTVLVLLANGANADKCDRWGTTARKAAIESGHHDIADLIRQALRAAS